MKYIFNEYTSTDLTCGSMYMLKLTELDRQLMSFRPTIPWPTIKTIRDFIFTRHLKLIKWIVRSASPLHSGWLPANLLTNKLAEVFSSTKHVLKLTELEKQTVSFRPNYVSSLQGLNQHYLLLGNQTDDLHVKGSKYGFYHLTQVPKSALIPLQIGTRSRI